MLEVTTHSFTKLLKTKYGEAKLYCRKDAGKIFMEGAPTACVFLFLNNPLRCNSYREPLEPVAWITKPCPLLSRICSVRSGVPNTASCRDAPFPCLGQDFGCVSWNARGLFMVDPILRDIEILELHDLCNKFCSICFQGTHGDDVSALLQSSGILRSPVFLHSGFERDGHSVGDAGGVGLLVEEGLSFNSADGALLPLVFPPPLGLAQLNCCQCA